MGQSENQSYKPSKEIGGWLYVVAFSVFLGPIKQLFAYISEYKDLFPLLTNITNTSSKSYHPIYLTTITMESLAVFFIIFIQVLQILLFIRKDRRFPKIFSYYLIFSAVCSTFIYISISIYPTPDKDAVQTALKVSMQAILSAIVWISYMNLSVRVKETFTNQFDNFQFLRLKIFYVAPLMLSCILFVKVLSHKNYQMEKTIKVEPRQLDSKAIAEKTLENLVVIEPYDKNGKIIGMGSGFFILPNLIVTNVHVLKDAHNIYVRFPNSLGKEKDVELVAFDKATDIALIRTKELTSKSPLKLASINQLAIGSTVYAAGNPEGLEGTFSSGLVSNKQRWEGIENIQISAPISHGSSGGPILDTYGNVLGIARAFYRNGQNLNLAIPSVYISRLIMRTEAFYPLVTNNELAQNLSISNLFTEVCDYLVDISLPTKYFQEFLEKDIKEKKLEKTFSEVMPTYKRAWYNKFTDGVVVIGSQELSPEYISSINKTKLNEEIINLITLTKENYKKSNPSVQFKSSRKDINNYTLQYNLESKYPEKGGISTDYRSIYFVLPYCRFDILYVANGKKVKFDNGIYDLLTKSFSQELPGAKAEKALFEFSK